MKKLLLITILSVALQNYTDASPSISAESSDSPEVLEQNLGYHDITTEELKRLIDEKANFVLLDTRVNKFYDGRRIPGAVRMLRNSSPEQIARIIKSYDVQVVVYCTSSHCPVSRWMAQKLVNLGYSNVWEYPEGIDGWIDAGNEVDIDN